MTLTELTPAPVLQLPTTQINRALEAIGEAQLALIRADNLEWMSVAADEYVAELRELHSTLARLAHLANDAHAQWFRARSIAHAWGQL